MIEIERKFLVKDTSYQLQATKQYQIVQGFLNTHPERTVRVRIKGEKGYLTVKGKSNIEGTTRFEWEKEIDKSDAKALLSLCEKGVISKTRFEVNIGQHTYEIDEFSGENEDLIVAEIELSFPTETFIKPNWLGKEVTGDIRYYNSQLAKHPFKEWK